MLATTYNIQQEYTDFPVHCNNYIRRDLKVCKLGTELND